MAAITAGEILLKRSIKTGSSGHSAAQADPNASLGTWISTTAWAGGALNDLFDDITGAENAAATTLDYRCIFVHNSNSANHLQNAVVWMAPETAGGANCSIAVDTTPASIITSGTAQAMTAATENAPGGTVTGLTWSTAAISQATGLSLGTINFGQCKAFWIRRATTGGSALSNDGVTINVAGDTGNL
jgi:hypothetical protein